MKSTQIFPTILILIQVASAAVCAYQNENKLAVYWLAAAVLNAAVTF
jgi:hypothetical protein